MDQRQWTARAIHEITNSAFWMTNETFMPDYPPMKLARFAMKITGINPYKGLRNLLFHDEQVIAVSGESVVISGEAPGTVDKHMFRCPHDMSLEQFRHRVKHEIELVQHYLGDIALATTVSIKPAHCFRLRFLDGLPTVTQTQQRLDLNRHTPLNLMTLSTDPQASSTPQLTSAQPRNPARWQQTPYGRAGDAP